MKLRHLAERLGCRLEGDGDAEIVRVAAIGDAGPGDLTFLANPRYSPALRATRASAVILGEDAPGAPCSALRCKDPYLTFAEAMRLLHPEVLPPPGIDARASLAPDVRLGQNVSIGPFVAIAEGSAIGDRSVIYPNVTIGRHVRIGSDAVIHAGVSIRDGTVIGDRVVVHDGAVIGSDGFGFAHRPDGSHVKIPQTSIVVIEDDVEIGANTTIDRPAVGETRIRAGAKIDNLVQVAHGVTVGRHTLLCAQVGIAGSTTIGDRVVLAGQVGVSDHLEIGDGVRATAQTGIPNSVEAGAFISGYPAIPNRDWLKSSAVFRRLPELKRAVAELEARVAELERYTGSQQQADAPPEDR